jgi:hypothetical protein
MKQTQIEILKLLSSNDIPEADLIEIKRFIIKSLSGKIDTAVDKLFKSNNWDEKQIENWGKKHLRTPYK